MAHFKSHKSSLPLAALAMTLGCALMAPPLHAAASPDRVTLAEGKGLQGIVYHIEGSFDVPVPRAQAWGVLTDYSALKGVVSSMQASCVLSRDGNTVMVEQVALGRFLFFSKTIHLLLRVVEEPQSLLRFSEATDKPFKVYNGSWTLQDKEGGTAVTYCLNVSAAEMAPPFIERGLFRENAQGLLNDLKAEIVRRAAPQASSARPDHS